MGDYLIRNADPSNATSAIGTLPLNGARAPVQKHSQGPKQVAGVPPLQAICEERHSIIADPESQVVFTGPLGMRPRPAIVFLRAFSENSTAASCVKLLPTAATLVQSAACVVTDNGHSATAASKPNLKICI